MNLFSAYLPGLDNNVVGLLLDEEQMRGGEHQENEVTMESASEHPPRTGHPHPNPRSHLSYQLGL